MSLPDTVFIFVLALIIFGPKKLPEIGRQLGRLVGEFRRASNEFKFQIEEELRQVDLSDRQTISAPKSEPAAAIESSSLTASESLAESEPLYESDDATQPDLLYQEEIVPVGQYPNIDNLAPNDLDQLNRKAADPEFADDSNGSEVSADTSDHSPTIKAAAGTQPRTNDPYTNAATTTSAPPENELSAAAIEPTPDRSASSDPAAGNAAPMPQADPDSYAAPTVADIRHG